MNNIILIAPPAAGKGTMAKMLSEKYGYLNISVGQLLRNIDPETELGKMIRVYQQNRELVDNEIVYKALKEKLSLPNALDNGIILDGFPRNMEQAEVLKRLEEELNFKINKIVYINIDYETALKRTLGRLICSECKTVYNINTGFNNPINDKTCRICNANLERRNDDNEISLNKGFEKFNNEILPLIEYYKSFTEVIEIDGNGSAEDTFKELEKKLKSL